MLIRGKVLSGKGEGKKYLSKKRYAEQFEKTLSFIPFPGTLNLLVEKENYEKLQFLRKKKGIIIPGFEYKGRKFGSVKCFMCMVNDKTKGAVIIPEKSNYSNIMEIISDRNLRNLLSLKEDDGVDILIDEYK